ncbi:heavy-metal-associated domain-containing protein [Sungkyunkwania multivorans]|uniref:Heavy-metal-associated domain-containing protein n=1 Tax=Sungkyunkwania multivorans TaxID=1173618 RepID=A0ABW3D3R2_9FLAO
MTKTYQISGMTCNNCKNSVEEQLGAIQDVSNVAVDLEKGEATLVMSHMVPLDLLEQALPSKYGISEKNIFDTNTSMLPDSTHAEESELKQLFPLFLIFFYIIAASALMNIDPWSGGDFMLDFMGLFYIIFSFFKFLDLKGFPASFSMYDPLAKVFPFYGWVYPFIETVLGLMFLFRFEVTIALYLTLIILGITTIGVTRTLFQKKSIQCACLGTALKLPMTKATFIENSVMIVMAILMLFRMY